MLSSLPHQLSVFVQDGEKGNSSSQTFTLRHIPCPRWASMLTSTKKLFQEDPSTDDMFVGDHLPFGNSTFPQTKRQNGPTLHYSTLALILGLTCILFPANLGENRSAHQVLAAVDQEDPKHGIAPLPVPKTPKHDDDTLAALTIYYEAKGESFAGKLAVAAVIRNRMTNRFQSDGTVRGTVLRPKQFEPWITRNPDKIPFKSSNPKMQESLLAWKLVQDGREVVNGAVLFYNPELVKSPRWAQVHRKVATIGGHEFFHTERI